MEDPLSTAQTEQVGHFTMAICHAQASPEAQERWSRRSEILAQWLLAEWQRDEEGRKCA